MASYHVVAHKQSILFSFAARLYEQGHLVNEQHFCNIVGYLHKSQALKHHFYFPYIYHTPRICPLRENIRIDINILSATRKSKQKKVKHRELGMVKTEFLQFFHPPK